tara:strand:- start:2822 stop:5485 length:2664 start_codon:yes stop_codon:yes gene_type:complete
MKQVNYKVNIETKGAQTSVENLNKDLSTTNKEVSNVNKSSKGFGKSLDKLGISMKTLGIGAVVGGITAIGGVFVSAMKTGAAFAKELSGLKAVLGASDEEMSLLSNSAKELGASTQFTAKQVVGLQTELAKLGFTTKEILDATGATLDLAASLGVGLSEAASITGSTLRAFGLETSETQRLVDVMALSTSKSALDYDALRESLKLVAPTARAMNVDIEETTSLLAVLADNGLKGSVAGTGLSKTFIELNKKGIPLNEALEKVKNSSNQLNTAIDLVGVVGSKSLLTLANNAPKIDKLNIAFDGAAGSARELAETRLDNLTGDTTKLGSAWEGFLLSIEDGTGIFNSIARSIVQAATAFLNFLTPVNKLSDTLIDQQVKLFEYEGRLAKLDSVMQDTATSTEDLKKAEGERKTIIEELQKQYPDYLKNINAEKVSTEELRTAINKVNEELVNKIIIQQQEEEIQEAAEDLADRRITKAKMEAEILGEIAELQAAAKRQGVEVDIDSTLPIVNQLIQANEEISKLEGNTGLQIRLQESLSSYGQAIAFEKIATDDLNETTQLRNDLLKQLGITTEEYNQTLEDNKVIVEEGNEGTETTIEETRSLIAIQEELLEQAKKLPETTEREIAIKNRKIRAINEEIKRLKALGLQQIKHTTDNIERLQIRGAQEIQIIQDVRDIEIQALGEKERAATLYYESLEELRQKDRAEQISSINAGLDMTTKALNAGQALGDAVFAHKMKNLEKGSAEEEAMAKKQFKFNKALQLGMAVIDAGKAITASLAQAPVAIGPVPNPAGIASLAFAGITSAAQIATIAAQKFQSPGTPTPPPSPSLGGGAESQPPAFNVVGQSGFNQIAGALGNQPPVQAFVVSQDVTTAQQLNNAIIETATF